MESIVRSSIISTTHAGVLNTVADFTLAWVERTLDGAVASVEQWKLCQLFLSNTDRLPDNVSYPFLTRMARLNDRVIQILGSKDCGSEHEGDKSHNGFVPNGPLGKERYGTILRGKCV